MSSNTVCVNLSDLEVSILKGLVHYVGEHPHLYPDESALLKKIVDAVPEPTVKPYIAQRLNVFLAGFKHLPHDTEVCVESGRPAGWTYSEREGRVYIHQ